MKKNKPYVYFDFRKYLPWIDDKKMFSSISFTHKLVEEKKPICTALSISAKYYDVDQELLAVWYAMLVENIRLAKIEKDNIISKIPKTWQDQMSQLEAIMLSS